MRLGKDNFYVELQLGKHIASVLGGAMGGFNVLPSWLFEAQVKSLKGETVQISSLDFWETVSTRCENGCTEIAFFGNEKADGISIILAFSLDDGIAWRVKVINESGEWSVMSVNYPTPVLKKEEYDLFVPRFGGRLVRDLGKADYSYGNDYPGTLTMQYFAVYSGGTGVYFGAEDETAAIKNFRVDVKNGAFSLNCKFYGIGATQVGNSFDLGGVMRWKCFEGDWYDAAMIYKNFVCKKAPWLPTHSRPDTPSRFKKIPFWISDYIPNTEYQGNNKPMLLSAGSDVYEPEYWYKAPLRLQKELGGVPIGYHVYNWHKIPFNIEYPHFLPAKDVFLENAPKLRESGIYVFPYINAVSWESRDGEMGHEINFENTGKCGAVTLENGEMCYANYPQMTRSGHNSHLVPMCPSFEVWHDVIGGVAKEMESTLPIDGIYFDEIAAHPAHPCYNPSHSHLPGGGSYWVDGDNRMMEKIAQGKPRGFYYFTESCAEPYMKHFDGYLTWNWVYPEDVPAFAAIYAGYVQMVGRVTDGKKKDDLDFFKYCTARSLVCGQQLGWCKADIIWRGEWLGFLKNAVKARLELTDVFNGGSMLRPPAVKASLPRIVTEAGLDNRGNIVSESAVAGAWYYEGETVIIAANIGEEKQSVALQFSVREYNLLGKKLPNGLTLQGDKCTVLANLNKNEIRVWRIK